MSERTVKAKNQYRMCTESFNSLFDKKKLGAVKLNQILLKICKPVIQDIACVVKRFLTNMMTLLL